jgi:hypothetical protein
MQDVEYERTDGFGSARLFPLQGGLKKLVPLLEALKVAARASFDKDDTIKATVNLPESKSRLVFMLLFICPNNVSVTLSTLEDVHHIPLALSPNSSLKNQIEEVE